MFKSAILLGVLSVVSLSLSACSTQQVIGAGVAVAKVPVKAAGCRIDPPVSVPVVAKHRFAATAAADPPDDPPGVKSLLLFFDLHGFIHGP